MERVRYHGGLPDIETQDAPARQLAREISTAMTVLYSLWQGGEASPSKETITLFLSGFERTLSQLSRLSEDASVLQQFTPAQLDPSRLNDLKSAVGANWTDAAPPPRTSVS